MCLLMSLTSCAAAFSSGPWQVGVDTYPAGAQVFYRGEPVGQTPCTVEVTSKSSRVSLRLDGYHMQEAELGTRSNGGAVAIGFLLFGPLELIVDAAADAWVRVIDDPITVRLSPAASPTPPVWHR